MERWLDTLMQSNGGLWTIGSLLVIATLIAVFQEHLRFGNLHPKKNSEENPPSDNVEAIVSRQRKYKLIEPIGSGDLCQVHRAAVGVDRIVLKIPRVANGQELMAKEFSLLTQLHKAAGNQVYSEYYPEPVESFTHRKQLINAYVWKDGFYTAEQILDRHHQGLDGRHLGWMFNRVLEALGFVHRQGWVHGAVLPPHLLFNAENHGLQLVGWIHAEKVNTALKVAPERFKDWYPPECQRKHPATPSVDIYLAAKSLIYLAGGDPVANVLPEHIPAPMQRFVKGCLLESPRMRCQDAWEVRRDFGEVLEGLYGPPAFHTLDMS